MRLKIIGARALFGLSLVATAAVSLTIGRAVFRGEVVSLWGIAACLGAAVLIVLSLVALMLAEG